MRAVVKSGPGPGISLTEIAEPGPPGPGEVLLEVAACGICGTDVHTYRGDETPGMRYPVVLGHEFAGTVIETGPGVRETRPGDRVVVESLGRCGSCPECRMGAFNRCTGSRRLGHDVHGGLAARVLAPASSTYRLPDEISFVAAALLKPLGVAVRVFERCGWLPGDRVAVVGPGAIGLLTGLVARASGASSVVVVGRAADEHRLALAAELGLATARGEGAHLVVDTTGSAEGLDQAVALARPGGTVAVVGTAARAGVSPRDLVLKELAVVGVLTRQPSTWQRAIDLVASGAVDVAPLVSMVLPLADTERGIRALLDGSALKVVIEPGG
ncbi:zinc-dependent alcohol dehydrogenase [Amycolatopsis jejuensis]|uniref:zinc-dependent alcohol dehydrogenase n=1 Tax=Amycolatopsis jejuensis TaxID=330084 RepID=UPI00069064EE|nr:alcohol dehydrogenase catalytic domain-containing protein [Amycolatopsis jejuensis]